MSLHTRALLLQLKLSSWSANKLDKRQTKFLSDYNNVKDGVIRAHRSLLPGSSLLQELLTTKDAIRTHHYKNTLPWAGDGMHILPVANFLEYMRTYRELKDKFDQTKRRFVLDYPHQLAEAKRILGALYNPDDYPDVAELDKRFNVELLKYPVPDMDFRVQLSNAEIANLREEMEGRLQSAQTDALNAAWQRLYDKVQHIADQLAKPNPRIHDSLMDNAREVCDTLTRLNVFNDPNLEKMRKRVEDMLVPPDSLRVSQVTKERVQQEAAKTAEAIRSFFTPADEMDD